MSDGFVNFSWRGKHVEDPASFEAVVPPPDAARRMIAVGMGVNMEVVLVAFIAYAPVMQAFTWERSFLPMPERSFCSVLMPRLVYDNKAARLMYLDSCRARLAAGMTI